MLSPELAAYTLASQRAHALAGSLSDRLAAQLADDLDLFLGIVLSQITSLRDDTPAEQQRSIRASHAIIQQAALQLDAVLAAAIAEQRSIAFTETLAIWHEAAQQAALTQGAAFGAIRLPRVNLAAVYANSGRRSNEFRTALTSYIDNAGAEIDSIIRAALLQSIPPAELARLLRPYVQGAETFYQAFRGRDAAMQAMRGAWRALSSELRGASRLIHYNARRIAESELHTAYGRALRTNGLSDPLVSGYVWTLSPDRGTARIPDICDALADSDFYGGGPGWFPKTKVPDFPHPFCRCSLVPTLRAIAHAADPLPGEKRILAPANAPLQDGPTPRSTERVREQLTTLIDASDRELSSAELALLAHGRATALRWQRLSH